MSGSSSGGDSGGRKKPPNVKNKSGRGQKVDLGLLMKIIGPNEEAINKGPNQKAKTAATTTTVGAVLCKPAALTASAVRAALKLQEVVKAASDAAPPPNPVIFRPPLGKKKKMSLEQSAAPTSASVAQGTSYAQQVSGSSKKSPYIEIFSEYVTPRPPPSEGSMPRPTSDMGMQELFDRRWQDDRYGMHFEHIRGSAQSAYLKAISAVIPSDEIFSFGLVGRGMVEVYTYTIGAATKLMLAGIEVGGRHLAPFPVTVKPTRVVFSRVPVRAKYEDFSNILGRFGKIHGKVRSVPLKVGNEGFGRRSFSTTREAYITLNQGCVLPNGFYLNVAGSRNFIEMTTEAKCYACHQVGHFIAECPKRARKVAETTVKVSPAAAETPKAVESPGAASTLLEHPVNKAPEVIPEATGKKAVNGISSIRESATSSDEEHVSTRASKIKRTKKLLKKSDQEIMPAPVQTKGKTTSKRKLSDAESQPRCSKAQAVGSKETADRLSDSELMSESDLGPPLSDYDSCGSAFSLRSGFEVASGLTSLSREKLRSLLARLTYKKSSEKIWAILKADLEDPAQLLPQLTLLQDEARKRQKYNEVARCERLHKKISSIIEEMSMDDALRQ